MSNQKERPVDGESTLMTENEQSGFFGELWQQVQLVYKLLLDPDVPIYLKVLPFAAVLYLLFPFDFLPDVIPGIGQLDDITILVVGAKLFIDLAPDQAVTRHLQKMRRQEGLPTEVGDMQGSEEIIAGDPDIIEGILVEDEVSADPVDSSGEIQQGMS
ncbi:MAG: DUF1232 domain-containing protein [Chloroflexi bacterium]|jgi:uncharacterized membrane protein YkvA (DUF1232 family)|nr:DUF1232 domain-containing protein [Chloroflexota bacterium]